MKIPEYCSPKPQLKLLLLHQTSPLVTIIITTALGENKACDAWECMETEGHGALKYNSREKTHSSWLTILISPSFRSPTMCSYCQGPSSIPLTRHHRSWEAARPVMEGGVIAGSNQKQQCYFLPKHVGKLHICRWYSSRTGRSCFCGLNSSKINTLNSRCSFRLLLITKQLTI